MTQAGEPWVVVLAAGDGTRLRAVTVTLDGIAVPKQFCTFGGPRSLLATTLARALRVAPPEQVVAVVAERHREWWTTDLAGLPPGNVVVQPENRGTAPGLLLPLLHVVRCDPDATVLVLPSDHHVDDEHALHGALGAAIGAARRHPEHVVLLGMTPDEPEPGYGWIVPADADGGATRPVAAFVEKPERGDAVHLMQGGALWSSFMMAATADALLAMFDRALPSLSRAFRSSPGLGAGDTAGLERLYGRLEMNDFSRDVLQGERASLRVLHVPPCGWSDLGTPQRVARWLARRDLVAVARLAGAPLRPVAPGSPPARIAAIDQA